MTSTEDETLNILRIVIISIAVTGLILNALSIFILNDNSLKHRFYKYLMCKSFIDFLVCASGGLVTRNILFHQFNDVLKELALRNLLNSSALSECYLVANRYFSITFTCERVRKIPFKYYFGIIFVIPTILLCPQFFWLEYENDTKNRSIMIIPMDNKYFINFGIFSVCFENIVPILIVTIGSFKVIQKYKQRMSLKRSIKNRTLPQPIVRNQFMTHERHLMITTLLLNAVFLTVRIIDMVTEMIYRKHIFSTKTPLKPETWMVLILEVKHLLVITSFAFNIFIYIFSDRNLKSVLVSYFEKVTKNYFD